MANLVEPSVSFGHIDISIKICPRIENQYNMFANKAILVAVLCIAGTIATTHSPCKEGAKPISLRVKGCESEPCIFYRGEEVIAEWDFAVVSSTDNLKPVVYATTLGITVPYTLPEQDACKSLLSGECPLDEGEQVSYGLRMPILDKYPKVSLLLEFALLDKNNNVHVCFQLQAKVADR